MSKRMFGVGRVTHEFVEIRVAPEGPPIQIPRFLYGTEGEGLVMANGATVTATIWGGSLRDTSAEMFKLDWED